ncbi:hypothetical protein HK096_004374 [Nowakowskiella sp. JEL0078]|nr:hypothetical protein HK096_004374 [Nowakowskiella sp. JEL0078]
MPRPERNITKKLSNEKPAPAKKERKLTPYNLFFKTELQKVKLANPTLTHREAFTTVALNWKRAPENPANKK